MIKPATPLPWGLDGGRIETVKSRMSVAYVTSGFSSGSHGLASISSDQAKSNAAFIVHAANCHEPLVEALSRVELWLTGCLECKDWEWDSDQRAAAVKSRDMARAALSLAQGEKT